MVRTDIGDKALDEIVGALARAFLFKRTKSFCACMVITIMVNIS